MKGYEDMDLIYIYVIFMLASIPLNLLIIVKKKKTGNKIFITNMAVADLMVAAFSTLVQVSRAETTYWKHSKLACKISTSFQGVPVAASILSITVMAVDRCMAINPIRRVRPWNTKWSCTVLCAVWLVGIIIYIPIFIVASTASADDSVSEIVFCIEEWEDLYYRTIYEIIRFSLVFAFPAIITITLSIKMCRQLYRFKPPDGAQQERRLTNKRRKLARILLIIAMVFVICWLPFNLLHLLVDTNVINSGPYISIVLQYLLLMGHANSFINPLIYLYMTRRLPLRMLVRMFFCVNNQALCNCRGFPQTSSSDEAYVEPDLEMRTTYTPPPRREMQGNQVETGF